MPNNLITKSELKTKRGWTDAGIKKFLSPPDQLKVNPTYRKAAPMQLFDLSRVQDIEQIFDYLDWQIKSQKRKEGAQKSVKTKKQKLFDIFEHWKPIIPLLAFDSLKNQAIKHYNGLSEFNSYADLKSDPLFLNRIMVNYIRHDLTNYDDLLNSMGGKVGKNETIDMVREQVYNAIGEKYPILKDECNR